MISWLEVLWTSVAAWGAVRALQLLVVGAKGVRVVMSTGENGDLTLASRLTILTSLRPLVVETLFVTVGVMAMFQPDPGVRRTPAGWAALAVFVLGALVQAALLEYEYRLRRGLR